jgi:hypothetical protein
MSQTPSTHRLARESITRLPDAHLPPLREVYERHGQLARGLEGTPGPPRSARTNIRRRPG